MLARLIADHPGTATWIRIADCLARSIAYLLGLVALAVAVGSAATGRSAADIAVWFLAVNGLSFTVMFFALFLLALMSWAQVEELEPDSRGYQRWLDVGLSAAAILAVVSLAYKLVGIGLGISSLADHPLTPGTLQPLMADLTRNFSMAFTTTVFGLVASSCLRLLILTAHRRRTRDHRESRIANGTAVPAGDGTSEANITA